MRTETSPVQWYKQPHYTCNSHQTWRGGGSPEKGKKKPKDLSTLLKNPSLSLARGTFFCVWVTGKRRSKLPCLPAHLLCPVGFYLKACCLLMTNDIFTANLGVKEEREEKKKNGLLSTRCTSPLQKQGKENGGVLSVRSSRLYRKPTSVCCVCGFVRRTLAMTGTFWGGEEEEREKPREVELLKYRSSAWSVVSGPTERRIKTSGRAYCGSRKLD